MPRKPSFRRDSGLQKEFRRVNKLVQNKQSKIRRNEGLEVSDVQTSKYKEFNSRKDIESYLKEMESFLHNKRDFKVENVHGVEINYSEIKEVEKALKRTNRQKEKMWNKVKDLPFKHRGKKTGVTVEQQANPVFGMGDVRFADLEPVTPRDPNSFFSKKEWEKYQKQKMEVYGEGNYLKKLNDLYKENYIKAMQNALGNESKKLQDYIRKMPMDKFMREAFTENNAHINFVYDRLSIKARVQELERVWGLGA